MSRIHLGKKFAEQQLGIIINGILKEVKSAKISGELIVFDLSDLGYISNQGLLVFSSLLRTFVEMKLRFKVNFLKFGSSKTIDKRKAKQLVQIWEVWQIYKVVPQGEIIDYFDIDGRFIQRIKDHFRIKSGNYRIYNRFGVTPFIILNKIFNYDDRQIQKKLEEVYKLNAATNEILRINQCELPFKTKTLSLIITKELFENFLDHTLTPYFDKAPLQCFMSLSLKERFNEDVYTREEIQSMISLNLKEELQPEFNSFYFDKKLNGFKNQSVLHLSFLDFGEGIPQTLRQQYLKSKRADSTGITMHQIDNDVIRYAFNFDSSKDPIDKRYLEKRVIPRGLFDIISIIKRFNGLLVIRSCYGHVLFDFSNETQIDKAFKYVAGEPDFFPGTLISIYIPERVSEKQIDCSVISPQYNNYLVDLSNRHHQRISLFEIQKLAKENGVEKKELYNSVFKILYQEFEKNQSGSVLYVDFDGYEIDERITKKVIYFLTADYHVNNDCSAVVINPPPQEFLEEIKQEMDELSEVSKNYYFHPTPFVYYFEKTNLLKLYWLGVFDPDDRDKLKDILQEGNSLRLSDFVAPLQIIGNVNTTDKFGNIITYLNEDKIVAKLKNESLHSRNDEIHAIISNCIEKADNTLYLCNGNYYQRQFVQIANVINDRTKGLFLSNILFSKIRERFETIQNIKFICISSTSQKILTYLEECKVIQSENVIRLDNYYSFKEEINFSKIPKDASVILVCDIISTGHLASSLINELKHKNTEVAAIAVFVDAISPRFETQHRNYDYLTQKLIALYKYEVPKINHEEARSILKEYRINIVRINPYSNTIISEDIDSNTYETIALNNVEFLGIIGESNIKIGYFKFNNLVHPYFFDMNSILKDESTAIKLLQSIKSKLKSLDLTDVAVLFFPKNASIKYLSKGLLRDEIFNNHDLEIIELERFSTPEGWKFLHLNEYIKKISYKKKLMILDDGSCSGESLIQMIDEVASTIPQQIIVLSIVGRINDQKREFFSRIKSISVYPELIDINIYFGCHWHIPTYYQEESPIGLETEWLKDALLIPNLPFKLKPILNIVLSEIELKEVKSLNNTYILSKKDNPKDKAILDLILMREQIGTIASYRFYKNDFKFFNDLVENYPVESAKADQTRVVECVCGVFLHEPILFEKVKTIIPDVVRIMQDFIVRIILGGTGKPTSSPIDKHNLYYHWTNQNLIHLLFIVFKGEQLAKLLDNKTLNFIIKSFCKNETDLNYLLYRFFRYMPIAQHQVENARVTNKLRHVLESVAADLEENNDKKNSRGNLKIFNSFLATLPFKTDDYQTSLSRITNNYNMLADDTFHNEYIFNDKQILTTQLTILEKHIQTGTQVPEIPSIIKNAWDSISAFIVEILNFDSNFPGFILPLNRKMSANHYNMAALRQCHGEITELINSHQSSEILKVKSLTDFIFQNYIYEDSSYPSIFRETTTKNVRAVYEEFILDAKKEYPNIQIEGQSPKRVSVDFPKVYLKEIVFKEILKNLRHADLSKSINISWVETDEKLEFAINNHIAHTDRNRGGGKGLYKLQALNSFSDGTKFKSSAQSNTFIQFVQFTKI